MYLDDVKHIVIDVLALPPTLAMNEGTALLGSIPELDSMAVVNLIGALESHFGISIEDDEIDAATFETLGSLAAFITRKLG